MGDALNETEHIQDDISDALESIAVGNEEGYEDDVHESVNSITRYNISTYGTDLEVELLVKRLNNNKYIIPDYQRGYVWTKKRASKFIESLLVGLPIPGIFLYKEESQFLIIDGHQRLRTLQAFYEGIFPGNQKVFKLDGVANEFEGKTYKELSESDQTALDSAIIHASVIEQEYPSEESEASSIYHIFERINSGSVPLTPHEIRYCANYGTFAKQIKRWNENPDWRILMGKPNIRMKDQEIILRFIALQHDPKEYSAPMQGFLDRFLRKNREPNKEKLSLWENLFAQTCHILADSFAEKTFKRTNAINVAIADALMVAVAEGIQADDLVDDFRGAIEKLKQNEKFIEATISSTSDETQVSNRLAEARAHLRKPS